jgi:hypothetical protein
LESHAYQSTADFCHEEIRIPKSWKGLRDNTQFKALVNGQPLSGRSLAIDLFSFPNAMVVHYLINKNDLMKLAQQVNDVNNNKNNDNNTRGDKTNATGIMKFYLYQTNLLIIPLTKS